MPEPDLLDGKYRALREIGRGSAGTVLEVEDVALGRRIALKIGPIEPAIMKARFLREGRAAAQLQSRHVAHVHRVGELADGRPYIAMDLLTGQTLADVLAAEGPIDPKRAVEWMLQALDALAEAHEIGLVHRDIKPSNLYLTERVGRSPVVKVLDFGLAKDATDERLTQTGDAFGTPAYVAPEQVRDASRSDARSDVWGIGVTLFELLSGKPPFSADNVKSLLEAIATAPTPPLPTAPSRLEAIVKRCLAKAPADRYDNGRALAKALGGLVPAARTRDRRRIVFVSSSLLGMAAATALAFVVWPRQAPRSLVDRGARPIAISLTEPVVAPPPESAQAPAPSNHVSVAIPGSHPVVSGTFGIVLDDASHWLAERARSLDACARRSNCAGKPFDIRVLVTGPVERVTVGCVPDASTMVCITKAVGTNRTFAEDQTPESTVLISFYY